MDKDKSIHTSIENTFKLFQKDITIKVLFDSIAEGVIIVDKSKKIILINKRLIELTGYQAHELIGKDLNTLLPDAYHVKHDKLVKYYFSSPHARPMGKGLNLIAQRKDNSTFPVEISLSYIDTEAGTLGIAFLTDISVRKEVEDELKKRNKELDAFAHTVAHDLNSYLNVMVGFSEILTDLDNDIADDSRQMYLKEIAHSGRKMSNVINELLTFSTMDKKYVKIVKIDMKVLIEDAIKRLKSQIKEKSAIVNIKENIIDCLGYAPWVEEIWLNYISNAIKYGGEKPEIEIGSEKTNNNLVKYYVKDKGHEGITDEHKSVIFQENNITKDKLTKGLGLGLSIVKRIAEKLDGNVSVESSKENGTIFSFYLKEATNP